MHLNSQTSIRTNTNTLKVAQNNLTHPNLQKNTSKLTLKHQNSHGNIRTYAETSELSPGADRTMGGHAPPLRKPAPPPF